MAAERGEERRGSGVLIVEDEILIGLGLAMALNIAGHQVHGPTGSIKRAIAIAAEVRPEIALVDINLQGRAEGVELARRLRECHDITIVFLTAQAEEARRARSHAFGMVVKPYDLVTIPRVVEAAARHRRGETLGPIPRVLELFH
jgi:DNA-binding response OmpR family regulator